MDFLRSKVGMVLRFYYAVIMLWISSDLVRSAYASDSMAAAFGNLVFAVVGLISVALLLLPEALAIGTRPLLNWIDSIYLPGEKAKHAPLDYLLADQYESTAQWEKLANTYERMLQDHAKEPRIYRGLVELYETVLPRPHRARWLRLRAKLELDAPAYASLSEERGVIEEGSPIPDRTEEPGYEIEIPKPPRDLPLFVF